MPSDAMHSTSTFACGTINAETQHRAVAKAYLDRKEAHIATLLSQFKQLVTLCVAPEEDAATLETQASRSLQIEMEWQALARIYHDWI